MIAELHRITESEPCSFTTAKPAKSFMALQSLKENIVAKAVGEIAWHPLRELQ